jgi:hypothetical protein
VSSSEDGVAPPTNDPWKGLRGVMAGTLVLEAIVVLLALPVVNKVGGGLGPGSVAYLVGLAVLMIVAAGMQRRPFAIALNLLLQVALIAGFFVHPSIGAMGLIFAFVWGFILYLRRDIGQRMEKGLLPGQQNAKRQATGE